LQNSSSQTDFSKSYVVEARISSPIGYSSKIFFQYEASLQKGFVEI